MKVRPKSDADVISSRARQCFFLGGSDGVKSAVSQCRVLVEIFGMIQRACVSISSVKQIMYGWKGECEARCKGKWLKLEHPSWTAAWSQRDVNLILPWIHAAPHTPTPPTHYPLHPSLLLLAQIALYPPYYIFFNPFSYVSQFLVLLFWAENTSVYVHNYLHIIIFFFPLHVSVCHSLNHISCLLVLLFCSDFPSSSQRGLCPGGVAQGHVSAPRGAVSPSPPLSFTSISLSPSPREQLTSIFLSCLARCSVARVMDWKL